MSKSKSGKMKDDAKRELKPTLRFPEFQDAGEWDSKPLGEFATIHKGKGVSKSDLAPDGKLLCIRYAELYTHYGEVIEAVQSRTNVSSDELVLSIKEDVIIPASGETKEDIATASCVMIDNVALGSDLNIVRSELHGPFFSYYLNGSKRFEIAKVAQGVTVAHLYPGQLEKIEVAYPEPDEQQKIADCLSSLDELIAAHSRKLDALKAHKKGLMQQLFPREGETRPRLRFPEFKDQWDEPSLDDLCVSVSSGKDKSDADGAFDLYGSTGIIGRTGKSSFDGPRILVARVGANAGFLTKTNGQYGVTDNTLVVSPKPSANIDYLYYYLASININKLIFGSGQPLITGKVLKNLRIPLPADLEQEKVADCLSTVDDLIEAQVDKVEFLKTHKKGLMQQLFPSLDRGVV